MTTQAPPTSLLPLTPEQLARLQATIGDYSPTQLAWLSGYFGAWSINSPEPWPLRLSPLRLPPASPSFPLRRPAMRASAEQLRDDLLAANLSATLISAGDYKFKQIVQERLLVIVASTQGRANRRKKRWRCINSCSRRRRRS